MGEQLQPSAGESASALVARAWRTASQIVAGRPSLSVTWADYYEEPDHLVVHDGAWGAALHFDGDAGPYWESRGDSDVQLSWADLSEMDDPTPFALVDWVGAWGRAVYTDGLTAKAAIYALIAKLLELNDDTERWVARPAELLTEEFTEEPGSAYALCSTFPSLTTTVEWYASQVVLLLRRASITGEQGHWHEPLWLITRDGEPWLVLDESGRVHLTTNSCRAIGNATRLLVASIEHDVRWGGLSFGLVERLPLIDGGLDELAEILAGSVPVLRRVW
jgi:hypothetical protein